jgi:hypothetical protein
VCKFDSLLTDFGVVWMVVRAICRLPFLLLGGYSRSIATNGNNRLSSLTVLAHSTWLRTVAWASGPCGVQKNSGLTNTKSQASQSLISRFLRSSACELTSYPKLTIPRQPEPNRAIQYDAMLQQWSLVMFPTRICGIATPSRVSLNCPIFLVQAKCREKASQHFCPHVRIFSIMERFLPHFVVLSLTVLQIEPIFGLE